MYLYQHDATGRIIEVLALDETAQHVIYDNAGRTLAAYERKVAADGALQLWLYLENAELARKNEELARENEELKREAVGESLADDLTAIIAALTAERDQLRQQVERLQIEQGYLLQQAEEAWEKLDDLQAAQALEEEWPF